ncbi:MAG TPA: hypothetical protein VGN60_02930 [Devosia sp.]|jgi:hypothetical protein|nr:hypothetical protein [Devosia sp.]
MPGTHPDKDKPEPADKKTPDTKDVEAGSDADETPPAEPGHTPADPNKDFHG